MAKGSSTIEISVYDNDQLIVKKEFQQDKIIIGRILSADLRVPNPRVSRIHALIENLDDGTFRLTDLASTHGSFVNGDRIVERILKASDEVKIADVSVRLKFDASPVLSVASVPSAPVDTPAPKDVKEKSEIRVSPQGHVDVNVKREATVIRSLKETARTRGALDPTSKPHEELELTVYWEETVLAVDHYKRQNRKIFLGDGLSSDYVVPVQEFPNKFSFIELKGNSAHISFHPTMKGSVRSQGRMLSIADLLQAGQSSIDLTGSDIAKVQVGSVNFFIMFVPEPPKIPKAPFFDQGGLYWGIFALMATLMAAFFVFGILFKDPIEGQVKEFPEKYRKIIVQAYKEKIVKKAEKTGPKEKLGAKVKNAVNAKQAQKGGNEAAGAKEAGATGKRGTKTAKAKSGITNRPKVAKNKKVQDAPKKARSKPAKKRAVRKPIKKKTLLDTLKNSGIGSRLAKAGDTGAAGNDSMKQALSGTGGGGVRSSRGSGGSGLSGAAKGGGGKAVGVGGLGTKGFGGGARGDGVGSLPGKGEASVSTESAGVSVEGSLTREEIERVVRAHLNEVRYCYQQALQRNPSLFGKVTLKWTIVSGGRVSSASTKQNTTKDGGLANCMLRRLRQWKFPSPRGGSTATVDYPWIFKPRGS